MFGRSRVRPIQIGLLRGIKCPCGEAGLIQVSVEEDETVPGYLQDDLAKCAYCGRIYVRTVLPQAGKIVGQGSPTARR